MAKQRIEGPESIGAKPAYARDARSGMPLVLPALCALGALWACSGKSTVEGPAGQGKTKTVPVVDATRFPHELHTGENETIRRYQGRGLGCADCHPSQAVVTGKPARPGLRDHAPCDECHAEEFYKPPGAFCQICHTSVKLTGEAEIGMQPYPERGFQKILASRFSHRTHMSADDMEKQVGFHVSCTDCHKREATSRDPMLPGHAQCLRCHEKAEKARDKLSMARCDGCHRQRDIELKRGRIFIVGDLIFAHADHETDLAGDAIGCDECHADVARSRSAAEVSVPRMQQCATCHEDSQKTPARVRIAKCQVCHKVIHTGDPPEDHLQGGFSRDLPLDHTLAFRRDHGRQAAADDAKCSYCHDGLSRKSNRDNCHQCHSVMRPRDHTLGWLDDSHGQAATSDRDRCATCHTGDQCVACHQVTPRSHMPLATFRLGGHATAARVDTRSCFACHTFENTCSNCHRGLR